jgi:hypothetical protein
MMMNVASVLIMALPVLVFTESVRPPVSVTSLGTSASDLPN